MKALIYARQSSGKDDFSDAASQQIEFCHIMIDRGAIGTL